MPHLSQRAWTEPGHNTGIDLQMKTLSISSRSNGAEYRTLEVGDLVLGGLPSFFILFLLLLFFFENSSNVHERGNP